VQTTLTCNLCRKDGPFTVLVAAGAAAASSAGAASEAAAAVADVIGATLRASGAAILRFSSPGRPPEYEAPVRGEFESRGTPAHSKVLQTFWCSLATRLPPKAGCILGTDLTY